MLGGSLLWKKAPSLKTGRIKQRKNVCVTLDRVGEKGERTLIEAKLWYCYGCDFTGETIIGLMKLRWVFACGEREGKPITSLLWECNSRKVKRKAANTQRNTNILAP